MFLFALTAAHAQEAMTKKREVGLQFSSINFDGSNFFSAFFKKQKSEHVFNRVRFLFGAANASIVKDNTQSTFNLGLTLGREKRKQLDSKLDFYNGPEASASIGVSANSRLVNHLFISTLRFGWILGLQHSFNDHWAINLETVPGVGITSVTGKNRTAAYDLSAGFSNNVSLGIVRKF